FARQEDFVGLGNRIVGPQHGQPELLPTDLRQLQGLKLGKVEADAPKRVTGCRAGDSKRGQLLADVGYLDLIHDDVTPKEPQNFFSLRPVGSDQERVATVIGIKVAQNVALWIQHKRVNASADSEITNVVRDHAVEPAHAVSSREPDAGTPAQAVQPA